MALETQLVVGSPEDLLRSKAALGSANNVWEYFMMRRNRRSRRPQTFDGWIGAGVEVAVVRADFINGHERPCAVLKAAVAILMRGN